MKETIVTIPINDLFAPKCGCPACRMENMLEKQYVGFVTGDAMMEPNIRIETNKKGFCRRHFLQMSQTGQKLPNALILETHLQEITDKYMPKKPNSKPDKKALASIGNVLNSCYVCDRIESDMYHLMATVFIEWVKGGEFRKLYKDQPFICLKHYKFIMEAAMAKGSIPSKHLAEFHADTAELTKNYLASLKNDISHIISMYDYRNRGGDWGTSVDAVERSIDFLTGADFAENNDE